MLATPQRTYNTPTGSNSQMQARPTNVYSFIQHLENLSNLNREQNTLHLKAHFRPLNEQSALNI